MQQDLSSGLAQSDLTIPYHHNDGGPLAGIKKKDAQVFVGEVVATFLLCFLVASTKVTQHNGSPIFAIGIGLVAIIYVFAPISGAQLNPAVTLGLFLRGQVNLFEAIYSVVAECVGGLAAGLVVYGLYGGDWDSVGYPDIANTNRRAAAFWTEVISVFFLLVSVLQIGTTRVQRNNSYYGIAFGFIVMSNALVAAEVSGACFNPAVAMLALLHGKYVNMWVYVMGPLTGSFLAWVFFRLTNPSEYESKGKTSAPHISIDLILVRMSFPPQAGSVGALLSMLAMEFIGTFMIAWVVALSLNVAELDQCIAIGTAVTAVVYTGGAVSGGHFNPCVTLGVYMRGKLESPQSMRLLDAVLYCFAQFLGAVLAGAAAGYVNQGYENIVSPSVNTDQHTYLEAIFAEAIIAAFLVLTVLCVGTSEKVAGNSYFGMAIGFVVLAGVVVVGDILPGSSFNTAIGIVLPLMTNRNISDIWVCIVGDILGSFVAFGLYAFWRDLLIKPQADNIQKYYDECDIEDAVKSPLLK